MSTNERRARSVIARAMVVPMLGALPAFLTGATGPFIVEEFRTGLSFIGIAVSVFFLASSLSSRFAGRVTQECGGDVGLTFSGVVTTCSIGLLMTAPVPTVFLIGAAIGGVGNTFAHTAANTVLGQVVPPHRIGLAIAVKQSAIPASTLLSGIAVSLVSVNHGWRMSYVVVLVASALSTGVGCRAIDRRRFGAIPRLLRPARAANRLDGVAALPPLSLVAVGGAFASGSATVVGSFAIAAGIHSGLSPVMAGYVLSIVSIVGIAVRLPLGLVADRTGALRALGVVVVMVATGAAGMAVIGVGRPSAFLAGLALAYVAGWSWSGLLHYFAVAREPARAAVSTGQIQAGLSFGNAAGPSLYSVLGTWYGHQAAWTGTALAAALGSLALAMHLWREVRLRQAEG